VDPPKRRELTPEQVKEALELIKQQARRIRTVDRDDLEGELARRLVLELTHSRSNIRNWNAYMKGLLYKKASNWIRDWRDPWEARIVVPQSKKDDVGEDVMERFSTARGPPAIDHVEQKITLDQFCERLPPNLRRMCRLLAQKKWTATELATCLGVSRNTVTRRRRKIQEIAKRYEWG
jgi:RNA polymerase sigma factor (sigma-70 family)